MKPMNRTRIAMWIFAFAPLILVAIMYSRLVEDELHD
mgnify:CR=1 FL=1